jgi:hypothetical protein
MAPSAKIGSFRRFLQRKTEVLAATAFVGQFRWWRGPVWLCSWHVANPPHGCS